jgi:hypothetical protein
VFAAEKNAEEILQQRWVQLEAACIKQLKTAARVGCRQGCRKRFATRGLR